MPYDSHITVNYVLINWYIYVYFKDYIAMYDNNINFII